MNQGTELRKKGGKSSNAKYKKEEFLLNRERKFALHTGKEEVL